MTRQPVITAGEPEGGAWCPVCLEPWRLRIPLYLDGEPAAVLEICPGCGTGHDKSAAYVTAQPAAPKPLLARLRKPRPAEDLCANGDCRRRARARHDTQVPGEDGVWTYKFCTSRCQREWGAGNGIAVSDNDHAGR